MQSSDADPLDAARRAAAAALARATPSPGPRGVVAGIDPGNRSMGYGVVAFQGQRAVHVDHGAFRPPREASAAVRLHWLSQALGALIAHHRPEAIALERAFVRDNAQSALRLGEARSVVLVAAAGAGLPIYEYSASAIKKAVTGHGRATKEGVGRAVAQELALSEVPTPHDASDALAIALCGLHDPRRDPRFAEPE